MSVTVVNGTNFPINTCLSLGINYDWRNQIPGNQYVVMSGFVDATLYARFSLGETSFYDSSAATIGWFVAGGIITLGSFAAGMIAIVVSGGAATPILLMGMTATYMGLFGEVVAGIALVAPDLKQTESSMTGVKVYQNRILIVEGEMAFDPPKDNVIKSWVKQEISIRDMSVAEFEELKALGLTEQRADERETEAVENIYYQDTYASNISGGTGRSPREIVSNDLLGGNVWVYPSFSGVPEIAPNCWAPQGGENGAIALMPARDKSPEWRIIPVGQRQVLAYDPKSVDPKIKNSPVQAYNIYNPSLDMYLNVHGDDVRMKKHPKPNTPEAKAHINTDGQSLFFIIRSLNCYVFVPISRQSRQVSGVAQLPALVNKDGGTGQGTLIAAGDRTGSNPGWARWVVERTNLDEVDPLTLPEIEALSAKSPLGDKLIEQPLRIYPAWARRHPVQKGERPVCWEISGDSREEGAFIQLAGRDDPKVQWVIEPNSMYDHSGGPPQVFKIRRVDLVDNRTQHATMSADGKYLVASSWANPVPIYIKYSIGFLSFFANTGKGGMDIWVDSFSNGARLRVGGLPDAEKARNLWRVISTTSLVAHKEQWKSS